MKGLSASSRHVRIGLSGLAVFGVAAISVALYWLEGDSSIDDSEATPSISGHEATGEGLTAKGPVDASEGAPEDAGKELAQRPLPSVRQSLSPRSASDYAELRAGAESGDATASAQLYLVLKNCDEISKETPSLANLESYQSVGVDASQVLARREAELEACAAIDPSDIAERAKWLSQAAEAGHIEAQLIFATQTEDLLGGPTEMIRNPEAVQRHKSTAMRYLTSAAATGDVKSMFVLANAYEMGVLTPRDVVAAHGLRLASRAIDPTLVTQQSIDRWGQHLTAEQRRAAEEYSRMFLRRGWSG